jgi:hypothetical protein
MTDCLDVGGTSSCFTGDGVPHECAPLGPGTPENQPLADLLAARNGTGDGASGALCLLENADASAVPGNASLPHCDGALACTPMKARPQPAAAALASAAVQASAQCWMRAGFDLTELWRAWRLPNTC